MADAVSEPCVECVSVPLTEMYTEPEGLPVADMDPVMVPHPSVPENDVNEMVLPLMVPAKAMDTAPQDPLVPDTVPVNVEPSLLMAMVMVPVRDAPAVNVPVQYPA